MRFRGNRLKVAAVLALGMSVSACANTGQGAEADGATGAAAEELTEVRFGGQRVAADAGLFLADELGFFADEGIDFEYLRLQDASAITNALSTGQLEAAGATITPGTFSAVKQDLGIKIVGDKNFMAPPRGEMDAVSASRLGVRPEFAKEDLTATLEALRGEPIAVHSELSIQNVYLSSVLEAHGFSRSDFDITPVLSTDQTAALANGAISAAVMQEPYFSQAVANSIAVGASSLTETLPEDGASTTALIFGEKLLEDDELGQRFMNAYVRGVRAHNDAVYKDVNADEVYEIVAENIDEPVESIANSFPAGIDPNQNLSLDWLQECFDYYVSTGEIDYELDMSEMIDTRFRDRAIEEMGEYELPID